MAPLHKHVRAILTATVAVTVGLMVVTPATSALAAEPSWTDTVDVASPGLMMYSPSPELAVDDSGRAVSAWASWTGTNIVIETSSTADGGRTWSSPVVVSAPDKDAFSPWVTMDSTGHAIVTWAGFDGTSYRTQSSASSDGGVTWSAPVMMSAAGGGASGVRVSFDAGGRAIAIWARDNGSSYTVQSSWSTDGGLTWSGPANVSDGVSASESVMAIDSSGRIIVLWYGYNGLNNIVQSSSSSDGGVTWSASTTLSALGGEAYAPDIAFSSTGEAMAVWYRYDGFNYVVQARSSSDGGATWGTTSVLSASGADSSVPQVTFNGAGRAIVMWETDAGATGMVRVRTSDDLGVTWSNAVDLEPVTGHSYTPVLSVAPDGTVMAVWAEYAGVTTVIRASTSGDAGLTWSAPTDVSQPAYSASQPVVKFDAENRAIVMWYVFNSTNYIVQSRSLVYPVLPNTGLDSQERNVTVALAVGILALGSVLLVAHRRRIGSTRAARR